MQPVEPYAVEKECQIYTVGGEWVSRAVRLSQHEVYFIRRMEEVFKNDQISHVSKRAAKHFVQSCVSYLLAFDKQRLKGAEAASESPVLSVRNVAEYVPGCGPGVAVARKLVKWNDYTSLAEELDFWSGWHENPMAALFAKGARAKASRELAKAVASATITVGISGASFGCDLGAGAALAGAFGIPDLCATGVMEAFAQAAERLAGLTLEPGMDLLTDRAFTGLDCKVWLTYLWALPCFASLNGTDVVRMLCERMRLALRLIMGSPLDCPYDLRPMERVSGLARPHRTWTISPGQICLLFGPILERVRVGDEAQRMRVLSHLRGFSSGLSCINVMHGCDGELFRFAPPNLLDIVRQGCARNTESLLNSADFWLNLKLPLPS